MPGGWKAFSGIGLFSEDRRFAMTETMRAMRDVDLRKVDKAALHDRSTVRIDPEALTEERINSLYLAGA